MSAASLWPAKDLNWQLANGASTNTNMLSAYSQLNVVEVGVADSSSFYMYIEAAALVCRRATNVIASFGSHTIR